MPQAKPYSAAAFTKAPRDEDRQFTNEPMEYPWRLTDRSHLLYGVNVRVIRQGWRLSVAGAVDRNLFSVRPLFIVVLGNNAREANTSDLPR